MALTLAQVQTAYGILNEFKEKHLPELILTKSPIDTLHWTKEQRLNPPLNTILGYDMQYDKGWDSLYFIVESPSEDLKNSFDKLRGLLPSTSISCSYINGENKWQFGWY